MIATMENTAVSEQAVSALRAQLRGEVILPGDASYEEARRVYNGMIDKHPALIARCMDAADVMSAVRFGREQGLTIAVRGGGHNGAGLGTTDDGLVIDLSKMRGVRVDPSNNTVRVAGGSLWGEVDHATYPFGLAVPTGFVSSTGVGGLTLGGGVGYLSRKYGLSIDNLLSADMVLADGSFVTASATENPDLFWAIRGGGGNFGIVTSFLFRGNPLTSVYGGPMLWPLDQTDKLLPYWQDLILHGPEELNGFFALLTVPPAPPFPEAYHLHKMCGVVWCYSGPAEQGEAALAPIRKAFPPAIDFAGPIPMPALQSMFDPLYPAGLQWYWRADFFKEYDDKAIALHIKYGSQLPSVHSTMHIYPVNGAVHRVGSQDTAWGYRDANFAQVIVGVDPDPSNNSRLISWSKDYWLALHPYSMGGGYVNMIMDEGLDRVKASYRGNYDRLAKIKIKYDPQNLFHVNQNIKPAS